MRIGIFNIPDMRLIPTTVATLDEIYKVKKRDRIKSKDLAIFLGYKYGTEPHYYRKIHALTGFGLLHGQGIFHISELGETILHPRDETTKKEALTEAVLKVKLWKEIYDKQGKNPNENNFWAVLMDITHVDPDTAKSIAAKILSWYTKDMEYVSDECALKNNSASESEDLTSNSYQDESVSQQSLALQQKSQDNESIQFGEISLSLPKKNLKIQWKKLQKYMEIYLEDYKESETKFEDLSEKD